MSTTKIIGTKPFVQLLAETLKKEYSRHDLLKSLGGFTIYDLAQESGVSSITINGRMASLKLHSELVIVPGKQSKTRVYLPPGVKPPA